MKWFDPKFILCYLFLLSLAGGGFYWFAFRPSQIRQECSWVHKRTDLKPAVPAIPPNPTVTLPTKENSGKPFEDLFFEAEYNIALKKMNGSPEIPAIPAKDWWEPASRSEYEFCVRSKGLKS